MASIPMRYLERSTAKGHVYWYYRRAGRRLRIAGEPGTAAFLAAYQRIHEGFERKAAVPADTVVVPGSFRDLAVAYLASPEYARLAPGTRENYRRHIDRLCRTFGPHAVDAIRMAHVIAYRDKRAARPGAANNEITVMRIVFAWGIPRDRVRVNPADFGAANVARLPGGAHRPWPAAAIARWRKGARPELVWAVEIGLATGQRLGDCLKMRWSDVTADGGIAVVQQKTGKELWVPITAHLAGVLAGIERRSVFILTTPTGRVWTKENFHEQFATARDALGLRGVVFHGLRKNAAQVLAEHGCSVDEIKSFTGHESDKNAAHYVKGANQKRLAQNAVARLVTEREKG